MELLDKLLRHQMLGRPLVRSSFFVTLICLHFVGTANEGAGQADAPRSMMLSIAKVAVNDCCR
jgi:hypothetical protein